MHPWKKEGVTSLVLMTKSSEVFFILLKSTADAQILVYFEKSISKAL